MLRMAKASVHVKRHLLDAERANMCAALEYFDYALSFEQKLDVIAKYAPDHEPLTAAEAAALIHEIKTARKVKVCRSKQREV